MSAVAIIPARGGSRRIPRKNIRDFMGKPIIAYSIEAAKASGLFDVVYVSTEDSEIASVAFAFGARILDRAHEYAADEIGTQEVMRVALQSLVGMDYACCIYPCAPMMTPEDLRTGFTLLTHAGAPYVYSVDADGNDAGQWYWGRVSAFLNNEPLLHAWVSRIDNRRVCDINTESDWQRAEQMYAALKEK